MTNQPERSIRTVAATINALLSVPCHDGAQNAAEDVLQGAVQAFEGRACDRVFMYNPDAIARWIYEAHKENFAPLEQRAALYLPIQTVYPPVTPVCFASMYSGLAPAQHGIQKYVKPQLAVNTVFDDIPRAGKRAAIISTAGDSISCIFTGRKVDYFIYKTKQECNEKALQLITEDRYDLLVLYNGDYDHWMHRFGPEGKKPLRALRENIDTWCQIFDTIQTGWAKHDTTLFFAPDHGCHPWLHFLGTHGIDEPCDMQTQHFAAFLPRTAE